MPDGLVPALWSNIELCDSIYRFISVGAWALAPPRGKLLAVGRRSLSLMFEKAEGRYKAEEDILNYVTYSKFKLL